MSSLYHVLCALVITGTLYSGSAVDTLDNHAKSKQEFLDSNQYKTNGVLRYEKIFGPGFISTGGLETTEEFVGMLDLQVGDHVLDVGCGIGGSASYMVKNYHARVTGVDLSSNMIHLAQTRCADVTSELDFQLLDITKATFPENTFDVIYSRDTLLHIPEKAELFKKFLTWLKPGGKLMITDYCRGSDSLSEDFVQYVAQRGYSLVTREEYGSLCSGAGFAQVNAEDRSGQFLNILKKELSHAKAIKEDFIAEFSLKDYTDIVDGWTSKIVRVENGDHVWMLLHASKPLV